MEDDNNREMGERVNKWEEHDVKHPGLSENGDDITFPDSYKRLPDSSAETDPKERDQVENRIYSLENDDGETFDIFETKAVGFIGRYSNDGRNEQWVQILEKYYPGSVQLWKDAGFDLKYTDEEAIHQLFSQIPCYPIRSKFDPTTEAYVVNEFETTKLPHKLEPDMRYWEQIVSSTRLGDQVMVYKNWHDELLIHVKQSSPQLASTWHTLNDVDPHDSEDCDELEATLNHFMSTVSVDR
ncbi:hypothetical protein [Halocatena halophila]|uniref:hypothetical protein n=1 Tax=Halocatena halophila TaxID=2814576 RepID=UPI002ED10672